MISDKDKLEALIGRAIDGGWGPWNIKPVVRTLGEEVYCFIDNERWDVVAIIFNHDFNKALFGEEKSEDASIYMYSTRIPEYQWRMMRAVISPKPINYLYQAVFGEEK